MGFFSRHRKAFRSVIASFGMLFGLLAGVSVTTKVGYASFSGSLNGGLSSLISVSEKSGFAVPKDATWMVGGDSISGTVTGGATLLGAKTGSIVVSNVSGNDIELSFGWDFQTTGGYVDIGGDKYTQNILGQEKTLTLSSSSSLTIELHADNKQKKSDLSLYAITALKISRPQLIFSPSVNGAYTVDGYAVNETYKPEPKDSREGYKLIATPNNGYSFVGWQADFGSGFQIRNIESPCIFRESEPCTVTAIFSAENSNAMFLNDGQYFADLDSAISTALTNEKDHTVVVAKSGKIAQKNYSIPSKVTLMVPCQEGALASEFATEKPKFCNSAEPRSLYKKLILPSGSSLTVYGTLVVACKILLKGPTDTGVPTGGYGQIVLEQFSSIIVQNSAKFFCWGFATGDGNILAKTGATIYEMFQITAWRGGTASLSMDGNKQKVFMVNQYYVQNIECLLRLDAGSTLRTTTGMYMSKDVTVGSIGGSTEPCFTFIGDGGMFALSTGYLTKKYNASLDRLEIVLSGKGVLSGISFVVELLGKKVDMDSSKYVLPINGNISFTFKEGSDCIVNQDLDFLPGSEINVENGATFRIGQGHSIVLYDQDNWGDYAFNAPLQLVPFTPTAHKKRTTADLVDAKFSLDGTFLMEQNSYFMTTGEQSQTNVGARIISPRRTGIIQLSDATSFPEVHQCTQSGSAITYVSIPRSCAKLQNGDHSYTQSAPGNTYHYDKVLDRWSISTEHATKSGLFKTIDNNGTIKTVLLENDVMAIGRTGIFHYSADTYQAGDNHYYYLQSGVVVSNKKWYQEGGEWYFFGSNQYAYQDMSAVFTASTGITGFGIQARYFFNDSATVERLVTVNNVVGLSQDITISTIGTVKYCYYKSIKAGVGLFEKQSGSNYSVYLAKDDGTLMTNGTYYVPSHKINNIKDSSGKVLTAGLYYFDENGHMYDSNFKVITRGTAS